MMSIFKVAKKYQKKLAQEDEKKIPQIDPWEQTEAIRRDLPYDASVEFDFVRSQHNPEDVLVWLDAYRSEYGKDPKKPKPSPIPRGLYLEEGTTPYGDKYRTLKETGRREFIDIAKEKGYNVILSAKYNWNEALEWLLDRPNTPGPKSLEGSYIYPEGQYQMSIGPYDTVIDLLQGEHEVRRDFNYVLARDPNTNIETLEALYNPEDIQMLSSISVNPNCSIDMLNRIVDDFIIHPDLPISDSAFINLSENKNLNEEAISKLMNEDLIPIKAIYNFINHPNINMNHLKSIAEKIRQIDLSISEYKNILNKIKQKAQTLS